MGEEERLRLGSDRKLIFRNICNSVPIESIMLAFHRSALELQQEFAFVSRKIREYRYRRCVEGSPHASPPIACDSYADARQNRLALLETLEKLGPKYLSSELLLPRIHIAKMDSKDACIEVAHRMKASG